MSILVSASRPKTSRLVPPLNFAMVSAGVYRSGYPNKKNFSFIQDKLGIRTIVYLCPEDYRRDNIDFCERENISVEHCDILRDGRPGEVAPSNFSDAQPFAYIDEQRVAQALKILLDPRRHPVLIHCHKGDHSTGCIVGCFRRLQQWSLSSALFEYKQFTSDSPRSLPQRFIDCFNPAAFSQRITLNENL